MTNLLPELIQVNLGFDCKYYALVHIPQYGNLAFQLSSSFHVIVMCSPTVAFTHAEEETNGYRRHRSFSSVDSGNMPNDGTKADFLPLNILMLSL